MSNITAIAIILATLSFAGGVLFYASECVNRHIDAILAGVLEGVPMSTKHRNLKLSHMMLQEAGAIVGLAAVMAIGYVGIARNVVDPAVTTLAYVATGLCVFGAVSWLFGGASSYIHCMAAIRQAKAD